LEFQTVSSDCVALYVHRHPAPGPETAASLIRGALRQSGLDAWPRMEIDLFPAGSDTLIVARPASEMIVSVAGYALPFLREN
jgi:hypothetical protein